MDLKSALAGLHSHLGELETAARKLANQNFADLIKSARGRLSQALEHPDIDAVGELLSADLRDDQDGQEKLPFEPAPFPGAPPPNTDSAGSGAGT